MKIQKNPPWIYESVQKNENRFLQYFRENSYILYFMFIFFVPLIVGHWKGIPVQLVVGSTVNFLLALAAFRMVGKKVVLLIVLPGIAAYLSGIIFGPATVFLLYLLPFIWMGNGIYVYAIRFMQRKTRRIFSIGFASIFKAGLLFSATLVLVSLSVVPELFLLPMGLLQLTTALIGGVFAVFVQSRLR